MGVAASKQLVAGNTAKREDSILSGGATSSSLQPRSAFYELVLLIHFCGELFLKHWLDNGRVPLWELRDFEACILGTFEQLLSEEEAGNGDRIGLKRGTSSAAKTFRACNANANRQNTNLRASFASSIFGDGWAKKLRRKQRNVNNEKQNEEQLQATKGSPPRSEEGSPVRGRGAARGLLFGLLAGPPGSSSAGFKLSPHKKRLRGAQKHLFHPHGAAPPLAVACIPSTTGHILANGVTETATLFPSTVPIPPPVVSASSSIDEEEHLNDNANGNASTHKHQSRGRGRSSTSKHSSSGRSSSGSRSKNQRSSKNHRSASPNSSREVQHRTQDDSALAGISAEQNSKLVDRYPTTSWGISQEQLLRNFLYREGTHFTSSYGNHGATSILRGLRLRCGLMTSYSNGSNANAGKTLGPAVPTKGSTSSNDNSSTSRRKSTLLKFLHSDPAVFSLVRRVWALVTGPLAEDLAEWHAERDARATPKVDVGSAAQTMRGFGGSSGNTNTNTNGNANGNSSMNNSGDVSSTAVTSSSSRNVGSSPGGSHTAGSPSALSGLILAGAKDSMSKSGSSSTAKKSGSDSGKRRDGGGDSVNSNTTDPGSPAGNNLDPSSDKPGSLVHKNNNTTNRSFDWDAPADSRSLDTFQFFLATSLLIPKSLEERTKALLEVMGGHLTLHDLPFVLDKIFVGLERICGSGTALVFDSFQIYDPLGGQTPEQSLAQSGLVDLVEYEEEEKEERSKDQSVNKTNSEGNLNSLWDDSDPSNQNTAVTTGIIPLATSSSSDTNNVNTNSSGANSGDRPKKRYARRRATAKKLSRFMSSSPLASMLRVKQMHEDAWIDSIVSRRRKLLFVRCVD